MKMTLLRTAGLACSLASLSLSASADIAIFTDGRTMKVSAYQAKDDLIELQLASGGVVSLPIDRIDRIVDDEIVEVLPVAEAPGEPERKTILPSERNWKFDEATLPLFESKYNATIIAAAKKFDVDAALVSAVIKAESDYDSKTLSHKGARGLMQLMPATAKRFGVANAFDPVQNIYGGTRYLSWLLRTFKGNADLAVAAYNAGEGNVWKYDGIPPFRETVTYVNRIARHLHRAPARPTLKVAGGRS